MVASRIAQRLREQASNMNPAERESILKHYLPEPIPLADVRHRRKKPLRKTPIRTFLKTLLYQFTYTVIHIFFGIFIRLSQTYHAVVDRIFAIVYYHHRAPELIQKDVKGLERLPEHLSVILSLRREDDALAVLMDEVAELAAWSTCAGIPALTVYEQTGILKSYIPALYRAITTKFSSYYGPSQKPNLLLFAPHHPVYDSSRNEPLPDSRTSGSKSLVLLILSATDGRETFVDLTKTLAEMCQNGKLSPKDITTELVDAEISEITTQPSQPAHSNGETEGDVTPYIKPEPDLLLVFGPSLILDGYPPWHIRLTEMFCTGARTGDMSGYGEAVEYQGFLRGLWHYAGAQMRFGR